MVRKSDKSLSFNDYDTIRSLDPLIVTHLTFIDKKLECDVDWKGGFKRERNI